MSARKAVEMPQEPGPCQPCRPRLLLKGLRPRAGWGTCSRLARPQGLQLGWLLWSRCSAPSLPGQLTLSPERCFPKRARLPKGPTCVPNPAGISCLSEFPSPTPIPGCSASRPGWGLSTCDKHLVAGPAHGRGLGRKHPPSLRSWWSVFRSRAPAGSPGELSVVSAHISSVRLHHRDTVRLLNRRGGAVTDCPTRPTQGHGAQNPPFLAGSALGPGGLFSSLLKNQHMQHRASHKAQDTGRAPRCVWDQEGVSSILILMGLSCLLLQEPGVHTPTSLDTSDNFSTSVPCR